MENLDYMHFISSEMYVVDFLQTMVYFFSTMIYIQSYFAGNKEQCTKTDGSVNCADSIPFAANKEKCTNTDESADCDVSMNMCETETRHPTTVSLRKRKRAEKKSHNRLRYDQTNHLPDVDTNVNATRCKNENCAQKTHFFVRNVAYICVSNQVVIVLRISTC